MNTLLKNLAEDIPNGEIFDIENLRSWASELAYENMPAHERAVKLAKEWTELGKTGVMIVGCNELNWIFTEISGYIPEFDRASKASSKEEILQLIEDVRAGRNELRILLHKAGVYGGADYGFVNLFIDLGLMSYSSAYIGLEEAIQYTFEVLLKKVFQILK